MGIVIPAKRENKNSGFQDQLNMLMQYKMHQNQMKQQKDLASAEQTHREKLFSGLSGDMKARVAAEQDKTAVAQQNADTNAKVGEAKAA